MERVYNEFIPQSIDQLKKPVLMICLTDGKPFKDGPEKDSHNERHHDEKYINKVVRKMHGDLKRKNRTGAVSIMLA